MSINREEWLKAVTDCVPRADTDESVLTTRELAHVLGKAPRTIRDLLPELLRSGKVTATEKRVQTGAGLRNVRAYRLTGK